MDKLRPVTRNLLSLLKDVPVIFLKKVDSGRSHSEKIFEELKSLSGNGFQVFENSNGLSIVRDGAARSFLL